jgi:hypothetical protein
LRYCWGNGSAMRVSPVGRVFKDLDRVLLAAKNSAEATHNHFEGSRVLEQLLVQFCWLAIRFGSADRDNCTIY